LEIPEKVSKNIQISNFMKLHLVTAQFFYADRQMETDMTKLHNHFFPIL